MYSSAELKALAERKAALRLRIAERSGRCVAAAAELARPLALVDRGVALWRRIAPFGRWALVSIALFTARKTKKGGAAGWLRYAPVAMRLVQQIVRMRAKPRGNPAASAPEAAAPAA